MLGGFIRFSLVPVSDMFNKEAHDKYAFRYTCADTRAMNCTNPTSKMCHHDSELQHYRYIFQIPEIFCDGIYVIAMARYGSFPDIRAPKLGYGVADYYSCTRVHIMGGTKNTSYIPTFKPGPTIAGDGGYCRAIYNDLKCSYKLCSFSDSAVLLSPKEFSNGVRPEAIMMEGSL